VVTSESLTNLVSVVAIGTCLGGLLGLFIHDFLCPKHGRWRRRG